MAALQDVQDVLERILGATSQPFLDAFWRGLTRDELVSKQLFGKPLVVVGKPEESYLVSGLRNIADGPLRAYFARAHADSNDLAILESWIVEGCPEVSAAPVENTSQASDDQHEAYWRAIDFFFQPSLASPTTLPHVLRMHGAAVGAWLPTRVAETDPDSWPNYLAQPDVAESFAYVRHHQRRLLNHYYQGLQGDIFDSLWKFGGSLLPIDPNHPLPPLQHHRMNAVLDWFFWCPYLDASVHASDAEAIDLDLARAWQIGIVADGLLRTDSDRPPGQRMPIGDFEASDPDLFDNVVSRYVSSDANELVDEMVRRTHESTLFD